MLLDWTLIFLVLALVAAAFGFTGVAKQSTEIAKVLFIVFLIIYFMTYFFKGDHHHTHHHEHPHVVL